ncbi:FHA domain-containing protein [Rhodopirellula sp.]|nr:FHA domain-containing protein [Rhodopirellula sp.]MDB4419410.1 FHA domain-containing protein [bacterium]
MQVMLKVLSGSHEGRELNVSGEKFLIGRSESCQLRPKSESVSRKHCIIVLKDNRVLIQDLKSRNGTYVNDKRLPTDKAKVLAGGDQLRVGKLNFEVVIEHGLQAPKKPEVADMSDAAARTVEAGSHDSRFEEVDVDSWLNEADQIDRVRKLSDPETRQFQVKSGVITEGEAVSESEESESEDDGVGAGGDSTDLSVSEATDPDSKKKRDKKKPGKLPKGFQKSITDNSRDAADTALKRFFSGR